MTREIFFKDIKGMPVRVIMNNQAWYAGIASEVTNERIMLKPHLSRDSRHGQYVAVDLPMILHTAEVQTPAPLTQEEYTALQDPHPWRQYEGRYARVPTKSQAEFCGKVKEVTSNFVTLDEVIQGDESGNPIQTYDPIAILKQDILTIVPISAEKYEFILKQRKDMKEKESS
jgi:hypothetical protein